MTTVTLTLHVRVAWWVKPYLQSVALFARITGTEPDWERVRSTVLRGIKAGA